MCSLSPNISSYLSLAKLPVIYVTVQFRAGHPEICPDNKMLAAFKGTSNLIEGSETAAIHKDIKPKDGEVVVVKKRVNAFFNTELATNLSALYIKHIIIMGVRTSGNRLPFASNKPCEIHSMVYCLCSGVVLSTVRYAADLDYQVTVSSTV